MAGTSQWLEPESPDSPPASQNLRIDQPHSARTYDYLLGGRDNYPADREAGDRAEAEFPMLTPTLRSGRSFMHRVTRHLATEAGIRQFLDIGTGIPTSPNLHEVAQQVAPESHVVYVDDDPIVGVHARALLASAPEGRTEFIQADVRQPETILTSTNLTATLDFDQPVALTLLALLHFVPDEDDPHGIVRRLVDALPPGSYLALSHATCDLPAEEAAQACRAADVYSQRGIGMHLRGHDEVLRFFDGMELQEPGLCFPNLWRADAQTPTESTVGGYCALARKP